MMPKLSDLSADVQARVRGQAAGKKRGRIIGGSRARRAGAELERAVMSWAQKQGVVLERLPECGAKFVGKGKAHPMPICCDFVGVHMGRAVFLDAKRVKGGRGIRLRDPKIIKPHQRAFLHRMAQNGAAAGLIVQRGEDGSYFWVKGSVLIGDTEGVLAWDRMELLGSFPDFGQIVVSACGTLKRELRAGEAWR